MRRSELGRSKWAALVLLGILGCDPEDEAPPDDPPTTTPENVAPTFTVQPVSSVFHVGEPVVLSATATGVPTPTIHWQLFDVDASSWIDLEGETSSSCCDVVAHPSISGSWLRVVATNVAGRAESETITITVVEGSPPVITVQPTDVEVDEGDPASFSVVASGEALTYQWFYGGEGATRIPGATNAVLNLADHPSIPFAEYDDFRVVVSNPYGSVTSRWADLAFTDPPVEPPGPCPGAECIVPAPGAHGVFPHPADPVSVTPTLGLETDVTFRGWRKIQGGGVHQDDQVWEIELAPGVVATLTFPWGTFFENVPLRFSVVSDLEGLPFSGLIGAIAVANADHEELGEALAETPFTVTFTLSGDAATAAVADEQTAFRADLDGSELHRLPVVYEAPELLRIVVPVDRLGIVGLARSTSTERDAFAPHWPTAIADQLAAATAEPTRLERVTNLGSIGARPSSPRPTTPQPLIDEPAAIASAIAAYNDEVVPAVAAAYADIARVPDAIRAMLGWERRILLLGTVDAPEIAELELRIRPTIEDLLGRVVAELRSLCSGEGGFDVVQRILETMRQCQLLGFPALSDELGGALGACFRFQVSFEHESNSSWHEDSDLGGGFYTRGERTESAHQLGSGVIEGDVGLFLTTVVGGVPEGPVGLDFTYERSETSDQYSVTFVSAPVWGEVPVRLQYSLEGRAIQDEVLGVRMKDFGLVRHTGGGRAVNVWFIDWGPGRVERTESRTRTIEAPGGTIVEPWSSTTETEYVVFMSTLLPFPEIVGVPGESRTWSVPMRRVGGSFEWSRTQTVVAQTSQMERFAIQLSSAQ